MRYIHTTNYDTAIEKQMALYKPKQSNSDTFREKGRMETRHSLVFTSTCTHVCVTAQKRVSGHTAKDA